MGFWHQRGDMATRTIITRRSADCLQVSIPYRALGDVLVAGDGKPMHHLSDLTDHLGCGAIIEDVGRLLGEQRVDSAALGDLGPRQGDWPSSRPLGRCG
jgi:hypothetical protein